MPQGEPSVDREVGHRALSTASKAAIDTQNSDAQERQANKSTGTSRPRLRKDLKSSILSHLALTTGESTKDGSGPMNLDDSMIVD